MGEPNRCEVCGRELRTPASRARGRGPVCEAKVSPPAPTPSVLPGLSGRGGRAGQNGPDLLDGQAADPDQDGAQ